MGKLDEIKKRKQISNLPTNILKTLPLLLGSYQINI